jgi:hypothetical protein
MECRAKGLHESEMGTEYIHFHKAIDDRSMGGVFSNAGEVKGKGDAVVGKGGQEFGVPTSSVKIKCRFPHKRS